MNAPALHDLLDATIGAHADRLEQQVIAWRRHIHANPELGNREFETAKLVAAHLKTLGFDEVREQVAYTGVVGVLRGGKPGPCVALRADMDALPVTEETDVPFRSTVRTLWNGAEAGVMHACGHDTHVAILMGVAEILAAMRAELRGTVKFIFQPAEESSDPFYITIRGRQTHGAQPWTGIDPIVVGSQIVMGLQTIVSRRMNITEEPSVVTIGAFNAGNRGNIIPDLAKMEGTIRSFDEKHRDQLHECVHHITSHIAEAGGAKAEMDMRRGYPVTSNDEALTAWAVPVLKRVAGEGAVGVVPKTCGAEDFSYYQQVVPGFFFFIGCTPTHRNCKEVDANHSPRFYVDEAGLKLGVRSLSTLALDWLAAHAG